MKERDEELDVLEALLKEDGVEIKSLNGTADEAIAALVELLAEKGIINFQEFGKFYQEIIEKREIHGKEQS